MTNTINFSKETEKTNLNSSSTSGEIQTTKDKPSLFDSLLSSNNLDKEETALNNVNKNTDVKVVETEESKSSVKVPEIEEDTLEVVDKKEVKSIGSLLDRLVIEAKKDVKNLTTEEIKNLDNKTNIENSINIDTGDLEKKETALNNVNKNVDVKVAEIEEDTPEVVDKKEVKSIGSLLDRLVIEAKKDVKNLNIIEETKNLDNKTNIENSVNIDTGDLEKKETALNNVNKNVDVKVAVVEVEVDTLEVVDNKDVKNTTKEEVKNIDNLVKIDTSDLKKEEPSLNNINKNLDVNIVDKKDVKNLNIIEETKNLDNKTNIENSVNIDTGNLDKEETTLNNVNKNTDVKVVETEELTTSVKAVEVVVDKKEVKNIGSLLDRLVIEAEKDVKNINIIEETKNLDNKTNIENSVNIDTSDLDKEKVDLNINSLNDTKVVIVEENIVLATNTNKIDTSYVVSTTLSDEANIVSINNLQEPIVKTDEKKSLMDQLIQKNSKKIDELNTFSEIDTTQKESVSKDLISNIYLSGQKNSMNNQLLFNKNEALSLLKDGNSINNVKTSAEMLDLGLESVNLEQNLEVEKMDMTKKIDIDLMTRKNLLDNMMLEKNIKNEDVKVLITKSVEASSALLDNSLELADDGIVNVNSPLSYNIQSKIIGAKQQMSTMMSDIAKQMYENYRPPVTVFRINLNPLELGSIAILMKNDKNNGLSISMNVSNNTTLDALLDNQNILRNSLNKTFEEDTKFNLDFSSSNQNNNNQSSNQGNQKRFEQQMDTQSVLQLKEENKDREEKSLDYM